MNLVDKKIIRIGLYCGLVASVLFPLWSSVKLPLTLNMLLHFAFGPLLVIAFLMGLAIFKISKFCSVYGILGMLLGSATLILNLYTFPVPPRDASLVDLGPFVGAWFCGLTIYFLISQKRKAIL